MCEVRCGARCGSRLLRFVATKACGFEDIDDTPKEDCLSLCVLSVLPALLLPPPCPLSLSSSLSLPVSLSRYLICLPRSLSLSPYLYLVAVPAGCSLHGVACGNLREEKRAEREDAESPGLGSMELPGMSGPRAGPEWDAVGPGCISEL